MGLTLTWLSIIVLIPLAGLFLKTSELSLDQFWAILTSRRTLNALRISFGLAFLAAQNTIVVRIEPRQGASIRIGAAGYGRNMGHTNLLR